MPKLRRFLNYVIECGYLKDGVPSGEKTTEADMKNNLKLIGLFRGLTVTMASIMTLGVGMSVGAKLNESDINENLGTTSRQFVVTDEENARYKSDYDSWQEMTEAKHESIKNTMAEGIVLLKNDGVLPLSGVTKMNVFGRNSESAVYGGGGGAGQVTDPNIVNVKTALNNAGIEINDTLYNFYSGCEKRQVGGMRSDTYTTGEVDPDTIPSGVKDTFASYGNTAIIWLARCIGEGTDPSYGFMELDQAETTPISYVESLSYIEKIIVVLNEDNTLGVGPLANDTRINAILHVGGMGINGSEALAGILTGEINPSGHLTDTYAANSMSSAAAQNMYDHTLANAAEVEAYVGGATEYATKYIAQKEGIYVGYRYYETRYEDCVLGQGNAASEYGTFMGESVWDYDKEVCYPFGHGLSYTKFIQTLDSVKVSDGKVTATVTVKNDGKKAGKSVIQLYAQSPYTEYDKKYNVEKSAIQLMGFTKTPELEPGASDTYEVSCSLEFLASYDYTKAKTYILDDGDYYFAIGDNAHDALNNVLAKKSGEHASLGDESKAWLYRIDKFDDETYSRSSVTGKKITNLFDHADYNYFKPDSYEYLTRKDWSTFPETEEGLTANQEMMKELSGQQDKWPEHDFSYGDYDDVEVVETDSGAAADLTMLYGSDDYNDSMWTTVLNKMSWDEMCTFTQGNSLTRPIESIGYEGSVDGDGPAGFSGTFGADGENAENLSARTYQSQCTLASTWNTELAYGQGSFMGEDGLYLGKTSIWAPGANLHRTPYSARNFEYYSEDSMMAYYMGANQCKGLQDKGCIACPKHFAFNDQEKNRCSLINFINEQEARELQLRSFQGSFTEGGAMGTMTSFSRIGLVYAGASHELMTDLLRGEWGFKGYTVTDYAAWEFMHPVECLKAGTDMFDTTGSKYSDVILATVKAGTDKVAQAALREANKRVLYAYVNSHAVDGYSVRVIPWWEAAIYTADGIAAAVTLGVAAVYAVLLIKSRKDGMEV